MGSHKYYYLNVKDEFVIFLTSKLITFFIDGFTFGMKFQSIAYLPSGNAHIYWISYLKVKCTQYKISSPTTLKNAKTMFFLKLGEASNNFIFGGVQSSGSF
jgi:hypothetical protein